MTDHQAHGSPDATTSQTPDASAPDHDAPDADTEALDEQAADTHDVGQRERLRILVYSDDAEVREQVILALGRGTHPDLPEFEYVEVATEPVVIQQMDAGGLALAILDGEAVPAGGMGIARQLKDEIYRCPPLLVLTGRVQDNWLATWSRADGAVLHPLDPIELAETVTRLLRSRVPVVR